MLSLQEYEQLTAALETMAAPIKDGELILIPRVYVLKLLKTFVTEVE